MAECGESGDCLLTVFEKAAAHLTTLAASLDSERLLYLYARFKQSKEGPCNIPKPGFFNFQAKQKWEAWKELGNMSPQQAMREYVDEIKNLDANWDPEVNTETRKDSFRFGLTVSTLRREDEVIHDSNKTLFDWVKEGNVDRVAQILQENKIFQLHQVDAEGMTLLHWASDRGYMDMVEFLIQNGSCVNQQDADGQTPLHYASSCGHSSVVQVLLAAGADVSVTDNDGSTAADVAADVNVQSLIQR